MPRKEYDRTAPDTGSVAEVFSAFLRLGLTSFGGPIAHLGYFRMELVQRRQWVSEAQYAQLLAICQFLPGPASSQLGFSLGLIRAGWPGALAAFIAFTAPSVLALMAFAAFLPQITGPTGDAAIHGLKIVALAVVAHGVTGMLHNLCPDALRRTIAALAAVIVLAAGGAMAQLVVVALGAIAGAVWCRGPGQRDSAGTSIGYGPRAGWVLLAAFGLLLAGLPWLASGGDGPVDVLNAFYRAGALVFGGGHVVLPLLQESVVASGWVGRDEFLAGYGAAQAVPGPLFSFASYLGQMQGGALYAGAALAGIFLPGFLLVAGMLPFWEAVSRGRLAARAIAGVNAAVVGLLGAALYDPIFLSAVDRPTDLAIGVVAFTLLAAWRLSALWVVAWCVAASVVAALLWPGG